jgi:hypothetical protein
MRYCEIYGTGFIAFLTYFNILSQHLPIEAEENHKTSV